MIDLFFQGRLGPENVYKETLEAYAEIAKITIESKGDRLGEQARRLELIAEALRNR